MLAARIGSWSRPPSRSARVSHRAGHEACSKMKAIGLAVRRKLKLTRKIQMRSLAVSFRYPTSVEALCRKLSSQEEDYCADTHHALAEFAQQPRDPVGASNMEAQLRDLVMSQPGYTIRTIECRTSWCVAEVASLSGMFHFEGAIGTDSPLGQSLRVGLGWQTAYERDSSSASIGVTLQTFERRR